MAPYSMPLLSMPYILSWRKWGMPPDAGVVELVGPNRKISELHEVAIIHLGQLIIEDTYSARDDRPQARKDTERSTSAAVQPSLAQR